MLTRRTVLKAGVIGACTSTFCYGAESNRQRGVDYIDATREELSRLGADFGHSVRMRASVSNLAHKLSMDKGYTTGWWSGEIGPDQQRFGIWGIKNDATSREDLIIPGKKIPRDVRDIQQRANRFAQETGYIGGFWFGAHRESDKGLHLGVARIREGFGEIVDIKLSILGTLFPGVSSSDDNYKVHKWASLPGENAGKYITAYPLHRVDTQEGRCLRCIAFY